MTHLRPIALTTTLAVIAGLAATAEAQDAGDLLWRYPVASGYISNEPTVGPDGTIYASDNSGALYAINPDGTQRWTVDALRGQAGNADDGPVAVFADGTVLVAVNPLGTETELVAFNADGSFKWALEFTESIAWLAGPTVGPDGLAYAAQSGASADDQVLCVDSSGTVHWSTQTNPGLFEAEPDGMAIPFTRDGSGDILAFHSDQASDGRLFALDTDSGAQRFANPVSAVNAPFMQHLQLQVASDYDAGRLYMTAFGWGSASWGMRAFDADGSVVWTYDPTIASEATAPAVGPDGTIFVAWDLRYLAAVEPDGSERWQVFDDTPFREQPTPSPDGAYVVGVGSAFGVSGRVEAFDAADGSTLWEACLTLPEAGTVYPSGRAVFANDASAIYVNSSVFSGFIDGSYIYAFSTGAVSGCSDADLAEPFGTLDFSDVVAFLTAFATMDPDADLAEPMGTMDFSDVVAFLGAFGAGCP